MLTSYKDSLPPKEITLSAQGWPKLLQHELDLGKRTVERTSTGAPRLQHMPNETVS